MGPHRLHPISIITESSTEPCQPGRSQGLHPRQSDFQGIHSPVVWKGKLNYIFKEYTWELSDYPLRRELITDLLFITTYASGCYTESFQRQCFLIACLALLNIVSILWLMSRSLIKTKIHASYSVLFTQHSLSFTKKVGVGTMVCN